MAHSIVKFDESQNINYFGDNGLAIVTHIENEDENYLIIMASTDYIVNNINNDEPKELKTSFFLAPLYC